MTSALRGVLAHEMGHYAGGETRVSALVYRAGTTIRRTVLHLGPRTTLGKIFKQYAQLYQRVSLSVRRRQELRADETSVLAVGRAAHESALRSVQASSAAWSFFGDRYVSPVWESGSAPGDLYAGFRRLLAEPSRQPELR